MKECPRCGAHHKGDPATCPNCGRNLDGGPPTPRVEERRLAILNLLLANIADMPLLTLQVPLRWDYNPIGLVTAQSVAGTGLFAEIGSSVTDFFGLRSEMYRDKIRQGEDHCKNHLRLEAIKVGAHAVIGMDVDYADVGGSKAMLMVCMSGTAIRLNDLDALRPQTREGLSKASELLAELHSLSA